MGTSKETEERSGEAAEAAGGRGGQRRPGRNQGRPGQAGEACVWPGHGDLEAEGHHEVDEACSACNRGLRAMP